MGKRVKKGFAFFLSLAMLIMCVPAGVFAVEAADNQNVITGASYEDSKVDVRVDGTSINVKVPYSYTDKINAGYLTLRWDSGAKEQSMSWESGYDAVDVGESVNGTASYKVDGSDETYSSVYTVNVSRAEKVNASVETAHAAAAGSKTIPVSPFPYKVFPETKFSVFHIPFRY